MRLFVAADVSDDVRRELRRLQVSMRAALAEMRVPPRIAWVKEASAHLTLRFIGEVDEPTAAALETAFSEPFAMAPFPVRWSVVGQFPPRGSPRVVWLGPSQGRVELAALASLVAARVDPMVGAADSRPFSPHLTLARIKDGGRGVAWPELVQASRPEEAQSRVDHVTLYRSRPSPDGHTYSVLARAALA
jgi:RNA 2',3'-cyclic 3'-phosphodiesterase